MQTDTIETQRLRIDAYRLLSACFCEPDREALLAERVQQQLAEALAAVSGAGAAHARVMATAVEEATGDELVREYARLFVGPFELPAPPYGSIYREPGRQVCGLSTLAVAAAYERGGLRLDPQASEMPDHISIELEFVHHLLARELAAQEQGAHAAAEVQAAQARAFLVDELTAWAPRFAADLEAAARSPYYRELARCLRCFCAAELAAVAGAKR